MSNIGSIHFVSQNQNYPSEMHARALAKELQEPAEMVPSQEVKIVEQSDESAGANADFENDSQKDEFSEGKKRRGGRSGDDDGDGADGADGSDGGDGGADTDGGANSDDTADAQFFGQSISSDDGSDSYGESDYAGDGLPTTPRRHLDITI